MSSSTSTTRARIRRRTYREERARQIEARPAFATGQVDWRYAIPIVFIHLFAFAALVPALFSWSGLALLIAGTYFYGGLGINIAYHRLLTHRSFACPLWLEHFFTGVALCCLEDMPATWVANHRQHHAHSDERPDPHSPVVSFFWSHMGWLLFKNRDLRSFSAYERYARDVLEDPFYMRLQRTMLGVWIYVAHAVAYFLAGAAVGGWLGGDWASAVQLGASWFVWGVVLRTVVVWHITWSVNSLSHIIGYRTYETNENSRNNWLVALLTSGEGWHNNHHHDPASASNCHQWWEFDLMYVIIRGLERVGLAWNVIRPRHERTPRRV